MERATGVSTNIKGVSAPTGEAGATATNVPAGAGQLSRQSETLRAEVARFLETVRAA